jgi:hypothetical protein
MRFQKDRGECQLVLNDVDLRADGVLLIGNGGIRMRVSRLLGHMSLIRIEKPAAA